MYLQCADIGGTNARLQLWRVEPDGATLTLLSAATFPTYKYECLAPILSAFVQQLGGGIVPSVSVLAVCGPVWDQGRRNHSNNTTWAPHFAGDIELATGLPSNSLRFINDFEAVGWAVAALVDERSPVGCRPTSPATLHPGEPLPTAAAACMGAGTGLGACYLTGSGSAGDPISVWPSEAGMTDTLSPRSELEWLLLKWLRQRHATIYIEIERIVCGPGLASVAQFLSEAPLSEAASLPQLQHSTPAHTAAAQAALQGLLGGCAAEEAPGLVAQLAEAEWARLGGAGLADAAVAAVTPTAATAAGPLALAAVDLFLTYYGRTLGVAANTWLPYRGLYIAGGILPKLAWRSATLLEGHRGAGCAASPLLSAFLDQGPTMTATIARVPLLLLDDPETGLKGCLYAARQRVVGSAPAKPA